MKLDLDEITAYEIESLNLEDVDSLLNELRAARAVIKAAAWPMDHKLLTAALEHYEEVTK